MSLSSFNTTITELSGSSTFYDWFVKENSEIIAKLNLAKVSNVTGGDGILSSFNSSSGLVTLSVGGTSGVISAGLTFSGSVSFLGETIVPNLSYKISSITAGNTGFTFGSVIRVTNTGYTFAKADSAESAEVIGVLSNINNLYSVVTVSGKIEGNFTGVNSGSVLSAGCVYFLSGQTSGHITSAEPNTIGYVSKPVILGINSNTGIVVQYRGNYLNVDSVLGESGSNRIMVSLPTTPTDPRNYGFSAGSFISYAANVISGNTFFKGYLTDTGRTAIDGWFLSGSKNYVYNLYDSNTEYYRIPREEDFIVGMIETVTTSGGNVIYQVLTKGNTTIIPRSLLTGTAKGPWVISGTTYDVNQSGITMQLKPQPLTDDTANASSYQVGMAFQDTPTYWFVNPKPLTTPPNVTSNNSLRSASLGGEGSNYAFNGDFEIWQRTTGKNSAYTTSGNVYFADAWIRRQSNTGTSVQSLQRKTFNIENVDVEASPKYYVDIKCLSDSAGVKPSGAYSIGHAIEGINTFNGESITISFYAKCAAAILATQTVDVYFARYSNGSLVEKKTIGQVNITSTTWQKFTLNYDVPNLVAGSYTNDYVEIGLDLLPTMQAAYDASVSTSSNLTFSVASLVVYRGTHSSPEHSYEKYNDKLNKCQRYYFSTYTDDQTPGSSTMISQFDPAFNTHNFIYTPQTPYSMFKFPVIMRVDPTVTLYSPLDGVSNEIYNITARNNLRNCNSTKGYEDKVRYSPVNSTTNNTVQDKTTVKINLLLGIAPYDSFSCHIIADSSYSI